jgi:UDP-N-acetylmuramyl pentapeptide phosphotransferase/UDP-N-acetylglucosamine-1-phosphate transferase
VTVTYLATQSAFQTAYLIAALGVPTVGWILLIVGLKQRSRSRPQSHLKRRPQPSSPGKGKGKQSSGTTLIVVGVVLLVLGVLAIVGRLATAA